LGYGNWVGPWRSGGETVTNDHALEYLDVDAVDRLDYIAKFHDIELARNPGKIGELSADLNFLERNLEADNSPTVSLIGWGPLIAHNIKTVTDLFEML